MKGGEGMNSILNEVAMLRKDKSLVIDRSNKNRYRLVMQEIDGTKNAIECNTSFDRDGE